MVSRARKMMMKGIVPKLEAAGWRVRRGGWPCTLAAEARWDFCVTESGSLFVMSPHASGVCDHICSGEPIPPRHPK